MGFELDIGDKTPAELEKEIGSIRPGFYWVTLNESEDRDDGDIWLHFEIVRGDYKGRKLTIFLKNPDMVDDEKKQKGAKTRAATFGNRMGAVAPDAKGVITLDFAACTGREYIARIVNEEFNGRSQSRIEYFAGVYPATGHADIPNDALVSLGLPPRAEPEKKGSKKTPAKSAADPAAKPAASAASSAW